MTYVVTSGHVETLRSGRMVAPGETVSDAEARRNAHLIERGALTEKAPAKRKSKTTKED